MTESDLFSSCKGIALSSEEEPCQSLPEREGEQNWCDDAAEEEKKLRKKIWNKGENMKRKLSETDSYVRNWRTVLKGYWSNKYGKWQAIKAESWLENISTEVRWRMEEVEHITSIETSFCVHFTEIFSSYGIREAVWAANTLVDRKARILCGNLCSRRRRVQGDHINASFELLTAVA
jgi:hypothetical protein